jgi:hypothetical protein
MDENSPGKFRERHEDPEHGGLAREETVRRPRMPGLDLMADNAGGVAAGALRLIALADQLMPAGTGDVDASAAQADFGIAALLSEQRSERLAGLIDRMQALMAAGQWRPALSVAQEARAADPVSAHAMVLQVQCLMELGHYEPALRVVAYARERVADPEIRSLLLRREAACVRATTKALETRLVELVDAGKLEEGLALVQEGLGRQPSNIVFLYHLANLHCRRSDLDAARKTIEEARRHTGRESIDLIAELERAIEFGPHAAKVEAGRQALRQGDAAAALTHLDSCADALNGNEHYDGLRELARDMKAAGRTLFRATKRALSGGASRQQTLRWLVAEELRQGDEALRKGRHARAQEAFAKAGAVDARCGAVCYKHAQAIYLKHKNRAKGRASMDAAAKQDLADAEALAGRATVDAAYQEPAEALIACIRELGGSPATP